MRVWIDLANSPHVLFFAPIIQALERHGADVVVTARDFAQTVELAELYALDAEVRGHHGGRSLTGKATSILGRAAQLRSFAHAHKPDIAISHGSYALGVAARSMGMRSVTFMDYEHTPANHVSFRMATHVVLPSVIPLAAVRKFGATRRKTTWYEGFKEQVYLEKFHPDRSTVEDALPPGGWDDYVVGIARPPADFALYHRFENPLFEQLLRRVSTDESVRLIVLPRTAEQRSYLKSLACRSIVLPDRSFDGANLIYHADFVVSAGGTMNREAAVLGVPAYSLFRGAPAAVDAELARLDRLAFVGTEGEMQKIRIEKNLVRNRLENPSLLGQLVALIEKAAGSR